MYNQDEVCEVLKLSLCCEEFLDIWSEAGNKFVVWGVFLLGFFIAIEAEKAMMWGRFWRIIFCLKEGVVMW